MNELLIKTLGTDVWMKRTKTICLPQKLMSEKTDGAIKIGQSRNIGKIGYTIQ